MGSKSKDHTVMYRMENYGNLGLILNVQAVMTIRW